ncbi:CLAVATA3/ESR (CLE)-related protein 10 [Platanthera zijinensis]|uniref:CLAVATA3/ESR (CLE)-related protein 10 n=1 Tax=Platanthera zijinensis TaxID=2320716 RepID=A0AAP0B219_9ASPA
MQGMRSSASLCLLFTLIFLLLSSPSTAASRDPCRKQSSGRILPTSAPSNRFHEPPPLEEIDERYGMEKRLVPSGPNPLHN